MYTNDTPHSVGKNIQNISLYTFGIKSDQYPIQEFVMTSREVADGNRDSRVLCGGNTVHLPNMLYICMC